MGRSGLIDELRLRMEAIERGGSGAYAHRGGAQAETRPVDASRAGSPAPLGTRDGNDDSARAFSRVVRLLNASDKSEKALREKLAEDGYSPEDVDEAITRAKGYGYIDDTRFAEVLVRSRVAQGRGMPGIARELASHGIDVLDVPGWPEAFGICDDDEPVRALEFLRRKPPRSKNLRDGAFRKLMAKGYSASAASHAAREWAESR